MFRRGIFLVLFLALFAARADAQVGVGKGGDDKPHYVWPRSVDEDRRELAMAPRRENRDRAVRAYVEVACSQDAALRAEAGKALAAIPDAEKKDTYLELLKHPYHLVRLYTAQHCAALKDKRDAQPLFLMSIGDLSGEVRGASIQALRDLVGDEETVRGLGEAAWSKNILARIRAIEGIGKVQLPGGVEIIITRLKITYGGGARSYFFAAEQRAYIRDYDVQVATTAAAYEPIIGTVMDGVVLDARVVRIDEEMTIIERRVLNSSLENLTGVSNKNADPNAWIAWWDKNQDDPQWHLAAK